MGTNYYLHRNACPHCGRGDEPLHIGKSSGGWCFTLHVDPEIPVGDLSDWRALWATGVIKDEYGAVVTVAEMEATITERIGRPFDAQDWSVTGYQNEAQFHKLNNSERGPNGLLRHQIGQYCLKHGDGTWDCCSGEFS